jgi:hypothetical protein
MVLAAGDKGVLAARSSSSRPGVDADERHARPTSPIGVNGDKH